MVRVQQLPRRLSSYFKAGRPGAAPDPKAEPSCRQVLMSLCSSGVDSPLPEHGLPPLAHSPPPSSTCILSAEPISADLLPTFEHWYYRPLAARLGSGDIMKQSWRAQIAGEQQVSPDRSSSRRKGARSGVPGQPLAAKPLQAHALGLLPCWVRTMGFALLNLA